MIELLSLPRRNSVRYVRISKSNANLGLPINSMPGWEQIPLNCKLPMLKCPDNQVIFSKNKIGQRYKQMKQEFDSSVRDRIPEYNPLHDSNLKTFYSNERNLKRLRQNGEITSNNDVICTLKDFNEYRLQLHKSHLYYILQELNRVNIEQYDRMLIANAEAITARDHQNLNARLHSYNENIARKRQIELERAVRFKRLLQRTQSKFEHVAEYMRIQRDYMEHRKVINNMRLQQHMEVSQDLQRKRLISLKKLFQFKNDRLQKNLRELHDARATKADEKQIAFWNKRLSERIANQKRIKMLLEDMQSQKAIFIENHRLKYKEIWERIQQEIKFRARLMRRKPLIHRIRKRRMTKKAEDHSRQHSICSTYQESFDKLLDVDLCKALHTVIDIEGGNLSLPFQPDDPIYKAAKFILGHILTKFNKDLSDDRIMFDMVAEVFEKFFEEAKRVVTFRATQVITNIRQSKKQAEDEIFCKIVDSKDSIISRQRRSAANKNVAFSRDNSVTIGVSSYEIHPNIHLKAVINRTPTPPGSLASVRINADDIPDDDDDEGAGEGTIFKEVELGTPKYCRNEMIFVEHFIIKFKRELIVAIGRQVFAAIKLHFENKIMNVRKELLELDKNFLLEEVTKGILSYAVNPLNYESALRLCTSVLAGEIIWSLQKHLLHPERDPRGIVCPRSCSCNMANRRNFCECCKK